MIFAWENGRVLESITTGTATLEMKYDYNSMRTQKKVGNVVTNYYYDSNNNLIGLNCGDNTLFFYYDNNGTPTSFAHNGTMYYYVKNLQGDIAQIVDYLGNVVVTYTYDVWGKILSQTDTTNCNLADLNPFKYRGYVYDSETGLYYLQSRYHDSITGRFLNADIHCDTLSGSPLSTNMFAYCENNTPCRIDITGEWYYYISEYEKYVVKPYKEQYEFYKRNNYKTLENRYYSYYWSAKNLMSGASSRHRTNVKKLSSFHNYILGQNTNPYKSFMFGMQSTVGEQVCIAVALFNTLYKLEKNYIWLMSYLN